MNKITEEEFFEQFDEEALYPTGYEDCIIGRTYYGLAIMSVEKIIKKIMKEGELEVQDAIDHFERNIIGSIYENGPVYMDYEIELL